MNTTDSPTPPKAKRRPRPIGSVIEVGPGRFKLKYDLESTARGQRRTVYKTIHASGPKDARRQLNKLLEQAARGVRHDEGRMPLADWVETWLNEHITTEGLAGRTTERYGQLLRHYVLPTLGATPLQDIRPLALKTLYATLTTKGRRRATDDGPKGLHPRTVTHVHRALYRCLADAAGLEMIAANPAANIRRKNKVRASKPDAAKAALTKMKILDRDALAAMIEGFKTVKSANVSHALVRLAIDTGARRGELLALRWTDIDCDKRTVRIDRSVEETETYGVTIKDEPKNESSRRVVAISAGTATSLRAERERHDEIMRKAKGLTADVAVLNLLPADALVFPASPIEPLTPIRPRELTKAFSREAKRLGYPGLRFHDLRHNCASHMLQAGRSVPDVARHLGHATPAITMSVYAHAIPQRETGAGLLDVLLPSVAAE